MSRPLSLTTDPIRQLLWRIAIPASVGMFFNTMFNFVDTYCAGLLNTDALAGLSLSFPVFFALMAIGLGLSIAGVRLHRMSAAREAAGGGRGGYCGEYQRANLVTHFDRRDHLP